MPPSPGSRALQSFEEYSRTNLPELVEGELRARIEAQMSPVEERMRSYLIDIVRTCHSKMARDFQRLQGQPQARSPVNAISGHSMDSQRPGSQLVSSQCVDAQPFAAVDNSYQEPPHLEMDAGQSMPNPWQEHRTALNPQSQYSDSGYASNPAFGMSESHSMPVVETGNPARDVSQYPLHWYGSNDSLGPTSSTPYVNQNPYSPYSKNTNLHATLTPDRCLCFCHFDYDSNSIGKLIDCQIFIKDSADYQKDPCETCNPDTCVFQRPMESLPT